MAKVKAKVKCFVDNTLREAGEVFEYNGPENGNLELADKKILPEAPKPKSDVTTYSELQKKQAGKKKADEAFLE